MVLSFKVPEGNTWRVLVDTTGVSFLTYVLSFAYVGIYWNNHHHLLHAASKLSGRSLWANHHWLFWLSLLPFSTAWVDQESLAKVPVMCYGVVLLLCALAYFMLQASLMTEEGPESLLRQALKVGWARMGRKDVLSLVLYFAGIILAACDGVVAPSPYFSWAGMGCFVIVAFVWVVPDRRLERALQRGD